jgi:hypothetical protein
LRPLSRPVKRNDTDPAWVSACRNEPTLINRGQDFCFFLLLCFGGATHSLPFLTPRAGCSTVNVVRDCWLTLYVIVVPVFAAAILPPVAAALNVVGESFRDVIAGDAVGPGVGVGFGVGDGGGELTWMVLVAVVEFPTPFVAVRVARNEPGVAYVCVPLSGPVAPSPNAQLDVTGDQRSAAVAPYENGVPLTAVAGNVTLEIVGELTSNADAWMVVFPAVELSQAAGTLP